MRVIAEAANFSREGRVCYFCSLEALATSCKYKVYYCVRSFAQVAVRKDPDQKVSLSPVNTFGQTALHQLTLDEAVCESRNHSQINFCVWPTHTHKAQI